MTRTQQWRANRLTYIRALKKPTDLQRKILQLADDAVRTVRQNRELASLWKAEQLRVRAERADITACRQAHPLGPSARKARDHRLIQLGALVEIAGLVDQDRGTLLGGLLALASRFKQSNADQVTRQFKAHGDEVLRLREEARRQRQADGQRQVL